jgi:hypothetical protein
VPLVEDERVVVTELLSWTNVTDRLDPDAAIVDHRVAIRVAAVVDPARLVAVDGRVDDDIIIDGKEKRVLRAWHLGISGVRLGRGKALSGVFDESSPGRNRSRGKSAQAVDTRIPDLEWQLVGDGRASRRG